MGAASGPSRHSLGSDGTGRAPARAATKLHRVLRASRHSPRQRRRVHGQPPRGRQRQRHAHMARAAHSHTSASIARAGRIATWPLHSATWAPTQHASASACKPRRTRSPSSHEPRTHTHTRRRPCRSEHAGAGHEADSQTRELQRKRQPTSRQARQANQANQAKQASHTRQAR